MHRVPWNPEYYQPKIWNSGLAAERARHNLRLKKNKNNKKPQASSIKLGRLKKNTIKK
jgi:hypothetical protein